MTDTLKQIAALFEFALPADTARVPIEIPDVNRESLAWLFWRLGFTRGAEIGVQAGIYSEILCKANPNLHLISVDWWRCYEGYRDHTRQGLLDGLYEEAKARLAGYNCEIRKVTSQYALDEVPDGSLDFVYIDANHELPYVINDIIGWAKKVRKGGIISGHDYYESNFVLTKNHVKYAVDCYTRAYRIRPWFLLGTKAILPNQKRDKERSWMWVKR